MPSNPGQLLSADPKAGMLLSSDPNAGAASAPVDPPPARSLAERGTGWQLPGSNISSDFEQPSELQRMLKPLANPQSVQDLLPLLIPNGIAMAVAGGKHYVDAARSAYANARSVKAFPVEFAKVLYQRAFETNAASASRKLMSSGMVERYGPAAKTAATNATEFAPGADVERFKSVVRALSPDDLARLNKSAPPTLQQAITEALNEVRATDTASLPARVAGTVKSPVGIAERGAISVSPTTPQGMGATSPDKWGMTAIMPADDVERLRQGANAGGTQREVQAMYDRIRAKLAAKEPLTQMEAAFINQGKR